MCINHEPVIMAKREQCALCQSRQLEAVIDLPNLPLTGIFCQEPMKNPVRGIDQQLLFCRECGHAQLANQVTPNILYNDSYSFLTSASALNRDGVNSFLSALDRIAPMRRFNCVLDVGCNDLYLLEQMRGRANIRIGVDPVWAGREGQRGDKSITVIGASFEDAELNSILEYLPDLIVCRHTLEHIYEPRVILRKLLDMAAEDALFLFEVPNFEALSDRLRFDQIFHQHLQYFTLASFQQLLKEVGGKYISHQKTYGAWGSLIIAFTKRSGRQGKDKILRPLGIPVIRNGYDIFCRQMSTMNDLLKSLEGTLVYGYGAGPMLPVLAYHLGNDLTSLTAILDDSPDKDGMYYWNLPPIIRYTNGVNNLNAASFVITAVNNAEPILGKLLKVFPRQVKIFLTHYVVLQEEK